MNARERPTRVTNDQVLQLAQTQLDPIPVNVTLDMKETVTSAKVHVLS